MWAKETAFCKLKYFALYAKLQIDAIIQRCSHFHLVSYEKNGSRNWNQNHYTGKLVNNGMTSNRVWRSNILQRNRHKYIMMATEPRIQEHSDSKRSGWRKERHLDRGLGEGHSKMMVLSQIVVVEFNERLNCFFNRAHLDQGHLTVLPVKYRKQICPVNDKGLTRSNRQRNETYWKNLKALTVAPELANNLLRSSSTTDGLKQNDTQD